MHQSHVILVILMLTASILGVPVGQKSARGPEQIHISYGDSPSEMIIVWSTDNKTSLGLQSSFVHYGLSPANYTLTEKGVFSSLTYGNPNGLQFLHRVKLVDLIPGRKYSYRVQSGDIMSDGYEFTALRDGLDWSPQLLVYGDMGRYGGAYILKRLIEETANDKNTAVLHVGDFAYDMDTEGGINGDEFMNRIQPVATKLPYMTCVGNHEQAYNFSHYRYRFSMPQLPWPIPQNRVWFSFNMAKAHFISYSTEVFFWNNAGSAQDQLQWLENDLKECNTPENRKARPWIIAYGHRPMYCSNIDKDDCTKKNSTLRNNFESLFFKYGVDIIIEAHEHSYERLWPVYKETVVQKNYNNPGAPVHLISGAAGCNEFYGICVNPMLGPRGPWSAYRRWFPGFYGYGRLRIENSTHLYWEQITEYNDQVEDSIWVVQENHGPFKPIKEQIHL